MEFIKDLKKNQIFNIYKKTNIRKQIIFLTFMLMKFGFCTISVPKIINFLETYFEKKNYRYSYIYSRKPSIALVATAAVLHNHTRPLTPHALPHHRSKPVICRRRARL